MILPVEPPQTPGASTSLPDWAKVTLIALVIPALGFLWVWVLRPFLSAGVWHLLDQKPDKKIELFFAGLEDVKQQPRLKKLSHDIFGERITHVDKEIARAIAIGESALTLAEANRDAIEAFRAIVLQQGAAIDEVRKATAGMPQILGALDRASLAAQGIERTIGEMQVTVARIDERQKAIQNMVERRTHQLDPHPARRADDSEQERR
jgi:hypothetical protein